MDFFFITKVLKKLEDNSNFCSKFGNWKTFKNLFDECTLGDKI